MKKSLLVLTILLFVFFIVGCENSTSPLQSQTDNVGLSLAKPFGGESSNKVAKTGPKGPKGPEPNIWLVPGDFATIQEANDNASVVDGDYINVGPGDFAGAYISKELHIVGTGVTKINDGPLHPAGLVMGFRFLSGSDGASLSHLDFTVDLAIMNGEAVNNVEIHHNNFYNSLQAVSNWMGSGWNIHHNKITDLKTWGGGGIGIMVADLSGGIVEKNLIHHNFIEGTLHVAPGDGGGYSGSGIVLYADFRWGRLGSEAIKNNIVEHNQVSLVSDTPEVVDVVGFELTDTRGDLENLVLFDNNILKNDLRGTAISIALTPDELADINIFEKNKVN